MECVWLDQPLFTSLCVRTFGEERRFSEDVRRRVFTPTDTDIFFLGSKDRFRSQIATADFVYVPDKTVEELLLNFDLPCCRVATNVRWDYWVSAQCLASIFTGKYYMPEYLRHKEQFITTLAKHRPIQPCYLPGGEGMMYSRLQERNMNKEDTR